MEKLTIKTLVDKLGFKRTENSGTSPFTGEPTDFEKTIVDMWNKVQVINLTRDGIFIEIRLTYDNGYVTTDKELVFKGKCNSVEFFNEIIEAILK